MSSSGGGVMGMEVVQLKDQLGMVVDQDLYGKKVQLS